MNCLFFSFILPMFVYACVWKSQHTLQLALSYCESCKDNTQVVNKHLSLRNYHLDGCKVVACDQTQIGF